MYESESGRMERNREDRVVGEEGIRELRGEKER